MCRVPASRATRMAFSVFLSTSARVQVRCRHNFSLSIVVCTDVLVCLTKLALSCTRVAKCISRVPTHRSGREKVLSNELCLHDVKGINGHALTAVNCIGYDAVSRTRFVIFATTQYVSHEEQN